MGINTMKMLLLAAKYRSRRYFLWVDGSESESLAVSPSAQAGELKLESTPASEVSGLGAIGTLRGGASVRAPENGILAGKALAIATI